jgi:dihydrofolate synthase/folylpolyglutamate synthase
MQTPPHTLDEWLAHCERLHPKNIELGLDRVRAVAQRMGLAFGCPVITVAGTNGKGSTCAMLEAICLQAGWRTGVYTSPHLVHFEERCRVHGEIVRPTDLVPHFEAVEAARGDVSLTYFEFTTLAILRLHGASGAAGRGHPGSGPGRAAGRREHHRRRLRHDHQRGPGPHGLFGHGPRKHRL